MTYYAVVKGWHGAAVYQRWEDCEAAIDGLSGALFKKCATQAEAEQYIVDSQNKGWLGTVLFWGFLAVGVALLVKGGATVSFEHKHT